MIRLLKVNDHITQRHFRSFLICLKTCMLRKKIHGYETTYRGIYQTFR